MNFSQSAQAAEAGDNLRLTEAQQPPAQLELEAQQTAWLSWLKQEQNEQCPPVMTRSIIFLGVHAYLLLSRQLDLRYASAPDHSAQRLSGFSLANQLLSMSIAALMLAFNIVCLSKAYTPEAVLQWPTLKKVLMHWLVWQWFALAMSVLAAAFEGEAPSVMFVLAVLLAAQWLLFYNMREAGNKPGASGCVTRKRCITVAQHVVIMTLMAAFAGTLVLPFIAGSKKKYGPVSVYVHGICETWSDVDAGKNCFPVVFVYLCFIPPALALAGYAVSVFRHACLTSGPSAVASFNAAAGASTNCTIMIQHIDSENASGDDLLPRQ